MESIMRILHKETIQTRLFSFDMLQLDFCNELIEEIQHFEASGLPVMRPNSMNVRPILQIVTDICPELRSHLGRDWLLPLPASDDDRMARSLHASPLPGLWRRYAR